jgi:hypothetical protein
MAKSVDLKRLYGTTEVTAPARKLVVGQLRANFNGGNLGAITFQGVEILRGISWLVRDENWGTCQTHVSKIMQNISKDRLQLAYTATAQKGRAKLSWRALIELTPRALVFTITAQPDRDFSTNRTGFVVLHPIANVAGKPLTVTHTDGHIERARFPKLISPGQPFFKIAALDHAPAAGLRARVVMEGNTFEMEDQRNWGDASFKTYVCSLLDPWPYVLKAGEASTQTVRVELSGTARPAATLAQTNKPASPRTRLPAIGLSISPDDASATLQRIDLLQDLKPDFLTCYVDSQTPRSVLHTYAQLGRQSGLPVTIELVAPGLGSADNEVADAAKNFLAASLRPQCVVITQAQDLKSFQPTDQRPSGPSFEDLAQAARRHFPDAMIGGGMISFFTELNRKRPPQGVFDFITHSICPIVHDASDMAVMQTLKTLPHIFASAKAIIGKTPYHLGPTTIAARLNPYGADVTANPRNRRICLAPNDPRQFGTFAVAWNKGLIAAAARAGIKRVTLGGLCGPRGLLDSKGKPTPLFVYIRSLQRQ